MPERRGGSPSEYEPKPKNDDTSDKKGEVIGFEQFEAARLEREKEKKILKLQDSFLEHTKKFGKAENTMDGLMKKFRAIRWLGDSSYQELGENIEDEIVHREVEIESQREKFPEAGKKLEAEIEALEVMLEQWEPALTEWEELSSELEGEQAELLDLMGSKAYIDFSVLNGYDRKSVVAFIKLLKSSRKEAQRRSDEYDYERREREEIEQMQKEEDIRLGLRSEDDEKQDVT